MPDCHLALHFQADDEEEHRQEAVLDPMKDRPPIGCVAQAQTELLVPDRLERRPERRVRHGHRGHGREDQQNARGGASAREVKRRRTNTVPERAKHRVDERALVPGPIVAPRLM